MQQVSDLHKFYDELQNRYGDQSLMSVYGAGKVDSPDVMFVFMNPTGRNVSSVKEWIGLRAPWIGTKQVWDIFNDLSLISLRTFKEIKDRKPQDWDVDFANQVYTDIQNSNVYITNLAKCTQVDARPLSNAVFKEYLELMYREIDLVKPKKIVTFGNQVSSILLRKNVSVSNYDGSEFELLILDIEYKVFPTYYPVGQGRRNMSLALKRIRSIIS